MNDHLTDEQLVGYVHYTLTDAERETMDEHLKGCRECRARIAEDEALQRRIRYDLAADLKRVAPSPAMHFSAIAARLERRGWRDRWRISGEMLSGATAFVALLGMVVALVSVFEGPGWRNADAKPIPQSPWLMMACGCFGVTAMSNYTARSLPSWRLALSRMLAFVLWLGTAVVGLQVIVAALDMMLWFLFTSFGEGAAPVGLWLVLPLSIVWIAMVVGGGEYHYAHGGQASSWKLFGWTVAVELLILILPYWIGLLGA